MGASLTARTRWYCIRGLQGRLRAALAPPRRRERWRDEGQPGGHRQRRCQGPGGLSRCEKRATYSLAGISGRGAQSRQSLRLAALQLHRKGSPRSTPPQVR